MKFYLVLILVPLFAASLFCQQFTNWKNYTSLKDVRDLNVSESGVWAATGGGVFFYSINNESYLTLHKADGLKGISLSAVTNNNGNVWFGSTDGKIDIYNEADKSFNVILDIYNSGHVNKRINELKVQGDTVIVSSDFGVSLIGKTSHLFYDTFFKFGSFPTNTKVNSTLKLDLFYISTDEGMAIQKPGTQNLSAPESWNVYTTSDGLPSNKILKAGSFQDTIIVCTDKGFAKFRNGSWVTFIDSLSGKYVDDFIINGNSILTLSHIIINNVPQQYKLNLFANNQLTEVYSPPFKLVKLSYLENKGIFIASTEGIINILPSSEVKFLLPNSPPVNQSPSLSVDNNGVLWSASGKDGHGVGYYTYNSEIWKQYNTSNIPELPSNDVYSTYLSPDGKAYLGTWGGGFIEVSSEGVKKFNHENSGLPGIPNPPDPNFSVITGFARDSKNNIWILNYYPDNRKALSVKTPDDTLYHFSVPSELGTALKEHRAIDIDQYDTKWYVCAEGRPGLFYFNENKTFANLTDDYSGYVSTLDGLNDVDVRDIVVDNRGDVWVGTRLGVNIITNTSSVISSGNSSSLRITSVFVLRQQSVNVIAVDPLNQKWIGTNEGLLLVNSDGTKLLATFTSDNSALLSNQIRSLAVDQNSGIVYAGTDEGITSFETPYIKPLETFDKMFVFPNPFIIKDNSKLLTIDGLIRDTEIKILNINGELINEFLSPGGRTAYWDGSDASGKPVSTGVYLIVAYDQEGNSVLTGKVAVIRE